MKSIPSEFPKENPEAFPFKAGRGHATARIYHTARNGYQEFRLPYDEHGRRKFHCFPNYEKARDKGNEMLEQLLRGDGAAITMSATDKLIYGTALDLLRPWGVRLDVAVQEVVDSYKALEGTGVKPAEASRLHAKRYPASMKPKLVADVVTEFVQSKTALKKSTRYIEDLNYRLGRLSGSFVGKNIASVDGTDLRAFMDGLNLSPRSHNNFRGTVLSLFEFAKRRKYVPSDWNEFDGVEAIEDNGGAIEIFTPKDIAALLSHASEQLVPFLAIGAFAGLRSAEIDRLDWQDVKFDTGYIVVEKAKAKTRSRRTVPICDNLKAWLKPYAKASGKVWPHGHAYLYEVLQATATAAKMPWKQNALRHSYISYRVADSADVARTAVEAGNSPAMIFSNYRELVSPEEAKLWFAVKPAKPAKKKRRAKVRLLKAA